MTALAMGAQLFREWCRPALTAIVRSANRPEMLTRALLSPPALPYWPDAVGVVNIGAEREAVFPAARAHAPTMVIDLLEHAHPLGRGAALNTEIEAAIGDWLAVLDGDDTPEPDGQGIRADQGGARRNAPRRLARVQSHTVRSTPHHLYSALLAWPGASSYGLRDRRRHLS